MVTDFTTLGSFDSIEHNTEELCGFFSETELYALRVVMQSILDRSDYGISE
jgi:hypothetical protein